MKVTRRDIVNGLPTHFEAELENSEILFLGSGIGIVHLEYDGHSIVVPLRNSVIAELLVRVGQQTKIEAGDTPPPPPRRRRRSSRLGPKKGDIKEGMQCTGWDFHSPDIPGKRRSRCPETKALGYPIWEKINP